MKRTMGILLLVVGIALGTYGFSEMDQSSGSVEIADVEISAKDESQQTQGIIILVIGVATAVGGIVLMRR